MHGIKLIFQSVPKFSKLPPTLPNVNNSIEVKVTSARCDNNYISVWWMYADEQTNKIWKLLLLFLK